MTTTFSNSKNYSILAVSANESTCWKRAEKCDTCGSRIVTTGFYVAAFNRYLCPECYDEWCLTAPKKAPAHDEIEKIFLERIRRNHKILITDPTSPLA